MSTRIRPTLKYNSVDQMIDDLRSLRREGYTSHGTWSLPQISWHLTQVMSPTLKAPSNLPTTPEQSARWKGFLDVIRVPGGASKFPAGKTEPDQSRSDQDVEELLNVLTRIKQFEYKSANLGPLGDQPFNEVTEAHLLHGAHHLGFLEPKLSRRPPLPLVTIQDAISEIDRLRKSGYRQAGNWSLEQMSYHLSCPIPQPIKSVPSQPKPQTQPAVIERLKHYADHNAPLPGITAPPGTEPTDTNVPADVVEGLIARLNSVIAFTDDYVDLGPRGPIPVDIYKGFIRGHCAHHLSFLIPNGGEA